MVLGRFYSVCNQDALSSIAALIAPVRRPERSGGQWMVSLDVYA